MPPLPLKFDAQGLVPTIVQDQLTGQIRMFAYASPAAVRKTSETGLATFWSRSRGELWQKARVGGHETPVARVLADCDGDCIIYSSAPRGASCYSGAPSCFIHALEGERLAQASEPSQTVLAFLERVLDAKASEAGARPSRPPRASAVEGLGAKVRDEADELARALEGESDERVVHEAADTLYELVAGLRTRAIPLRAILAELADRLGYDEPRHPATGEAVR